MNNELIKRIVSSIILIFSTIFVVINGEMLFNIIITIALIISIYEWFKISKKKILKFFGIFFLIFAFYTIYLIRNDFTGEYIYLFYVLLICVSTDMGGFIFGKIFKGPKLTSISPNKTYSGVIGSYLFSLVSIYFYIIILDLKYSSNFIIKIIFFTLLISTISQIGDLLISYIKRMSNLKDTGSLIPGHGGILDRIDGMIFAFPFSYIIFSLNLINL